MGVRVRSIRPMTLEAPLKPNRNHLQTAFGGSINALATLAAYAFLWLELREDSTAHVVVAESSIRFRRPIRGLIRAICLPPDPAAVAMLKPNLAHTGRVRIRLHVEIKENRFVAAEFEGNFVAIHASRNRHTFGRAPARG